MSENVYQEPRKVEDWIKYSDPNGMFKLVSFVIAEPNIVNKPYSGLMTQKEFTQLLIYIVSILSNRLTFVETPISGLDNICEFLQLSQNRLKSISKTYSVPIAELNGYTYSTKERLSTWLNYIVDKYPYRKNMDQRYTKSTIKKAQISLYELKKMREYFLNKTEYSEEQIIYLDKRIAQEEGKIDKIRDSLAKTETKEVNEDGLTEDNV